RGMGAAVVLGEQLDVLVLLAAVDLVLDAEVGKVDLVVEVRQLVLTRPCTNLVVVSIRTAVAVSSSAVVLLQELLVLALQVLFEDDATDLEPIVLVTEPRLLLAVGRVEVRVVVELPFAAHARVERLRGLVLAVHRMRVEQVAPLACEGQTALVVAQVYRLD